MATYGPYPARVIAVHDGDTILLDLDVGFGVVMSARDFHGKTTLAMRAYGINAPELSTTPGTDALDYAQTLLHPGDLVTATSHSWDKYGGRWLGTITLPDGTDYAQRMLQAGHAKPYTGQGPKDAGEPPRQNTRGGSGAT